VVTLTDYLGKSDGDTYFIEEWSDGARLFLQTGFLWGIPGLSRTVVGTYELYADDESQPRQRIDFGKHGIAAAKQHFESVESAFYQGNVAKAQQLATGFVSVMPNTAPLYGEYRRFSDAKAVAAEARRSLLKACEDLTRFEGTLVAKGMRGIFIEERTVKMGLKIERCGAGVKSNASVTAKLYDPSYPELSPKTLRGSIVDKNGVAVLQLRGVLRTGDAKAKLKHFHPDDHREYEFTLRHDGLAGIDNTPGVETDYRLHSIRRVNRTQGAAEHVAVGSKEYSQVRGKLSAEDSPAYYRLKISSSGDLSIAAQLETKNTFEMSLRAPGSSAFEKLFLDERGQWPTYLIDVKPGVHFLRVSETVAKPVRYRLALKVAARSTLLPPPFDATPTKDDVFVGQWRWPDGLSNSFSLKITRRSGRSFVGRQAGTGRTTEVRGTVSHGRVTFAGSRDSSGKPLSDPTRYRGTFDGTTISGRWEAHGGNVGTFQLKKRK